MKPTTNHLNDKPKYSVPALEKTFAILAYLARNDGANLTDLSNTLNLAKTSTFTILHTLESQGYIRRDSRGVYHLGLTLYSLGMSALRNLNVKTTFAPLMEQLRNDTQFTVHLGAYDRGETVCLEKFEGPGTIRFLSYIGERKLMNTSGAGKAIAAFLPEEELRFAISKGFNDSTPNSIIDETAYRKHLEGIRERGYSIDDEEGEIGVRCLGAPIFMKDGFLFGAISVSTIKSNLPENKYAEKAGLLMAAAENLSRSMGYAGAYPKK